MSREHPNRSIRRERERHAQKRNDEQPPATRRHLAGSFLVIALVSCLLYANTLPNALVYDDLELISKNPLTHNPLAFRAIFGSSYWGEARIDNIYRPLTVWSLALNYGTNILFGKHGESPFGFHLVNLLLHAIVGCLLYRYLLSLQLPAWPSMATVLLFAAHPIHTEAVAGAVGRAEICATLFGVLFLLLHRQKTPVVGTIAYLLALWSKESAITFFPFAIVVDTLFPLPAKQRPFKAYGLYATCNSYLATRNV